MRPVVIIGTGPAGIAAALPLVEAGCSVCLMDGGSGALSADPERPSLIKLRQSRAWRSFLKSDLSGLRDGGDTSPKLRCAANADFTTGYACLNRIETQNFMAVGALAWGGLSNIWGAVAPAFDAFDLKQFPLSLAELIPSYQDVASRIGISGADSEMSVWGQSFHTQPALPLCGVAEKVWDRRDYLPTVRLARAPLAVLSRDQDGRKACNQDGACMWGCAQNAIYNSAFDLKKLIERPNVSFLPGRTVTALERDGEGAFLVRGVETLSGQPFSERAATVVLAAGTLPSTRLALSLLGRYDDPVPLLSTPGLAAAFCYPGLLGRALPEKLLGLPQIVFRAPVEMRGDDYAFGLLFEAAAMSLPDLAERMPLTRPGAIALLRVLLPSLCLSLVGFSAHWGRNTVVLHRGSSPDQDTLHVEGGYAPEFPAVARRTLAQTAREFRRLGLWLLPGSAHLYGPGALNHHVGTLPLGQDTDRDGELVGARGVFVADGSVFNTLPAKNHTFTVMANADRMGKILSRRILA